MTPWPVSSTTFLLPTRASITRALAPAILTRAQVAIFIALWMRAIAVIEHPIDNLHNVSVVGRWCRLFWAGHQLRADGLNDRPDDQGSCRGRHWSGFKPLGDAHKRTALRP